LERDGQRLARVGAAEDPGADIVSLIDEFRLTRPSVALQRAALQQSQNVPSTPVVSPSGERDPAFVRGLNQ
jgi:hypothetical protein